MAATLFPTTVIGSLPRPAWLRDIILDRKANKLSEEEAERLLDPAVETAISLQERAGLDEITDGEWRRESYVKIFAERVRGFAPDLISINDGLAYPAVVGPIEYHRPLALDEICYQPQPHPATPQSHPARSLYHRPPHVASGTLHKSLPHPRAADAGLRTDSAPGNRVTARSRSRHGTAR